MYYGLGAVNDAPTVSAFISSARSALRDLALKSRALEIAATDILVKDLASLANKFGSQTGPRILNQAQQTQDPVTKLAKLRAVQKATRNIMKALGGELTSAVLTRFLLLSVPFIGPVLALSPAELNEAIENAADDQIKLIKNALPNLPGPPGEEFKWWIRIGLGVGALIGVAYFIRAVK